MVFSQQNAFENVVCKIPTICSGLNGLKWPAYYIGFSRHSTNHYQNNGSIISSVIVIPPLKGLISQRIYEPITENSWTSSCFNFVLNDPIASWFCTCHDSSAVVSCAKLWPDLFIIFHVRAIVKIRIISSQKLLLNGSPVGLLIYYSILWGSGLPMLFLYGSGI